MRTKTKVESKSEAKSDTTSTTEKLTCTVCGKKFDPNDDTKYIIAGGYTCSWKCFSDEVKRREAKKKQEEKERYKENKNSKK